MPFRDWPLRIQDIIVACDRLQKVTLGMNFEDFSKIDEILIQGVLYNFIIIGEAAINVPDDIQFRYPQIPWRLMSNMRNVMAHEYFQVDLERVWGTIQEDIPELVPILKELLESELGEDFYDLDDPRIALIGLAILAANDESGNQTAMNFAGMFGTTVYAQDTYDCVLRTIGITALTDAINNGLSSSAGKAALKKAIRKIASRVLGWVGAAWAAYEFGDCMGWW